ncbi:hypothetical protein SDJN02_20091 [Cucurbita argyrosperma subsp. argyrosperma]|nr:hypothetical protein SDJN02_20091 [Cucurbita argyrosperma subsp. argyrosperma]
MSNPSDSAAAACRRSGRAPEKSSFAQTCNLLSQYLKEKRSLGITPRIEPKDEFPDGSAAGDYEPVDKHGKPRREEAVGLFLPPSATQMTIFTAEKCWCSNDLPRRRRREI